LCSIQAYTELLEMGVYGELTADGKVSLRDVNGSVTRLIDLVSNLIDIEQLESGNVPLNLSLVPARSLFEATIQAVSALAAGKNMHLEVDDGDVTFAADQGKMVQVLVNLASNAVKFSSQNTTIWLKAVKEGANAVLTVTDNGRVIPPDQLARVFDRFKQVNQSDSAERKGSGLGLSIFKSIVEQHNGKIGVTSKVGSGSTFWIQLPMTQQEHS